MTIFAEFFERLYATTGWNFSVFYDPWEADKYLHGVLVAFELAIWGLCGAMLVGLACCFLRLMRFAPLRWAVTVYVELFRNTPGLAQMYFLFFGIGSYFHLSTYGPDGAPPAITPFGFVVITLSLQYGAFVAEILRGGIDAVPRTTKEACDALGYSRWSGLFHVILPLAMRNSLPALGNNMAQIVKSTAMAYAIAVPEALYVAHEIWTVHFNVIEMMNVVLLTYLGMMAIFTGIVRLLERKFSIPGQGR